MLYVPVVNIFNILLKEKTGIFFILLWAVKVRSFVRINTYQ